MSQRISPKPLDCAFSRASSPLVADMVSWCALPKASVSNSLLSQSSSTIKIICLADITLILIDPHWEIHSECGANAHRALHPELSASRSYYTAANRQPEPGPTFFLTSCEKRLTQIFDDVFANPYSRIFDDKPDHGTRAGYGLYK